MLRKWLYSIKGFFAPLPVVEHSCPCNPEELLPDSSCPLHGEGRTPIPPDKWDEITKISRIA